VSAASKIEEVSAASEDIASHCGVLAGDGGQSIAGAVCQVCASAIYRRACVTDIGEKIVYRARIDSYRADIVDHLDSVVGGDSCQVDGVSPHAHVGDRRGV